VFTAGQFIDPLNPYLNKGDRMRILRSRAINRGREDLIEQITPEIFALHGNRYEIAKAIGLLYQE
jgi:hypothetical protein